ncbi:DNA cytosine methyltransferase [Nocardia brasiliensis]|uniref:DNA cytosine methyltransferase n=1 Tax=Nocardia brasiliensis TaxID=37326 RepID=UPI00366F9220
MNEIKIGSLFSGAGTLDLAALQLFPGSRLVWHCDNDPAASRVLAHHWPQVPNLGDITEIRWCEVEPVDVLVGGFPCQDVSLAGHLAGLGEGTRSGLWSYMAEAIVALEPRHVLIENVEGILSAYALRAMESPPNAVGEHRDRSSVRAAGAVLGALATLGLDAEWTSLRASAIGACHRRSRIFILAHAAAHSDVARPQGQGESARTDAKRQSAHPRRRHAAQRGGPDLRLLPTPSVADGTGGHISRSGARIGELLLGGIARAHAEGTLAPTLLPTPRASDGAKGAPRQRGSGGDLMLPSAVYALTHDPDSGHPSGSHDTERSPGADTDRWGIYADAIARQEALTRPAPPPNEPNRDGNPRLSPRFAEWMMMMPPSWVTDPEIGLSRVQQLRIIGNSVVVPCAVTAYRLLSAREPLGEVA